MPVKPWYWKNFNAKEMSCRCCGELYYDLETMDKLQRARDFVNRPMFINSTHRCGIHMHELEDPQHPNIKNWL